MTRRPINYSAKAKRLQTLALTIFLSIAVPSVAFFVDSMGDEALPYGGASFFAKHPGFLLMGVGLVMNALLNEVLKKRKNSQEKEILGKACGFYIIFAVLSFGYLQNFSPETINEIYQAANFIVITYQAGIVLSVMSILAGKS